VATRIIHLINPKTDSLTTRPLYMNRALYSPLAGLLAVAASIPRDQYEVILTDENIEVIDFDLKADLVGISAMTSYVNRGYEIADQFRTRGVPVVMGGVHPSFMPQEALKHCDAVVIGEVELVIDRLLDDLSHGSMRGSYKSQALHSMVGMPMPRYDLLKKHRYVNRTFIQTSRGCHQGCTFCAEPLMNGLKFRYRPVDEVVREMENCGSRFISINDADFFGTPERPKQVMRAMKGRGFRWQAGVTSNFAALVEKIHSYGIMVFGLFMFGFDGDDRSVFEETVRFNRESNYDACAYSVLTPYPGTLTWYEMKKANRIISFDWDKYDQGQVVYRPAQMSGDELRLGQLQAYDTFYALSSIVSRFPIRGRRNRGQWLIYNAFMRKGSATERVDTVAAPTLPPDTSPMPPILPIKREWREAVLEAVSNPTMQPLPEAARN